MSLESIEIVFVNGEDALDDAAWYVDGTLVGRDENIYVNYDILPQANHKVLTFNEITIPLDIEVEAFYWPDNLGILMEGLADANN